MLFSYKINFSEHSLLSLGVGYHIFSNQEHYSKIVIWAVFFVLLFLSFKTFSRFTFSKPFSCLVWPHKLFSDFVACLWKLLVLLLFNFKLFLINFMKTNFLFFNCVTNEEKGEHSVMFVDLQRTIIFLRKEDMSLPKIAVSTVLKKAQYRRPCCKAIISFQA